MEALVILFGEFLFALFGGLALIMGEGVLLLLSSVFCWLGWIPKKGAEEQEKSPAIKRTRPKWMIFVQRGALILLGISLVAAFLINTVFFEPALRKISEAVGSRANMELSFTEASGSFLPGCLQLSDVVIKKEDPAGSNFNLSVERIGITFNLFALLGHTANVDVLEIEGLKGTLSRRSNPDSKESGPQQKSLEARKKFVIKALRVQQSSLVLEDESKEGELLTLPVAIDRLEAIPLRSSFAVFDILFRSNAAGTISGESFSIQTKPVSGGRSTQWKTENLPVALLSHYVGAPFGLLQEGVVDVDVEDFWKLGRQTAIDTHWSLVFRNVVAEVPSTLEPWAAAFAEPAVKYINDHSEKLSINLDFTMNEDEFKGVASLDAAGLWKVLSRAFIKEVSGRLNISGDELKSGISDGFGRFKNFLDEKRNNKTQRPE